ncbi:hypothetical protein, partial [Pseudomonas sp. GW460-13]|uniref:hypothetical protein n=1 Tax=Pseudomonas sp. GW460-13 TaxID=2070590 RepID=UPI001C43BEE4
IHIAIRGWADCIGCDSAWANLGDTQYEGFFGIDWFAAGELVRPLIAARTRRSSRQPSTPARKKAFSSQADLRKLIGVDLA